jgi:hypothetical protein
MNTLSPCPECGEWLLNDTHNKKPRLTTFVCVEGGKFAVAEYDCVGRPTNEAARINERALKFEYERLRR